MESACETEIRGLHEFFVGWLTGALPPSEEALHRFSGAVGGGFTLINPEGKIFERTPLIDQLRSAHGVNAGPGKGFRIWVQNVQCRFREENLSLMTYEEWQENEGKTTGRISTALFRARPDAPNGVEWLHVHETRLPGQGAGITDSISP